MKKVCLSVLLALSLACGCCGCGKTESQPEKTGSAQKVQIGVLFADRADATGLSHYHLLGLQKAAEALELPDPVCKYSVTDVTFDASAPVTATTAKETEAATDEPESYTTKDGEVILRGVPLPAEKPESAVSAAANLLEQGCGVIVATDPVYDNLTAFLAEKNPDTTFLQYRGTHTDLPNLQSFTDNLYEAFYLAGAAAGCEGVKQIGFTARTGSREEIDCINAFALGAAGTAPDARVIVRMIRAPFDLYSERTVPLELIEKDKCELLAQSVFTALPVSVAAGTDSKDGREPLPCIGFGYDMQSDGGARYLCSVVFDFSVYYTEALRSLADGSFDASPYAGGVREGIVGLSALYHVSDRTKKELQTRTDGFENDTLHPLEGFKPAKNGYASNVTIR